MEGFKNTNLASLFARHADLQAEMAAARDVVEAALAPKRAALDEVNADITELGRPLAQAAYAKAEKHDGTVTFASGDAIFKSTIKKTVSYDSATLMEIAGSIPWEQAKTIFKFEASIGEKAFAAIEDELLKTRIMEARTVKYGEPVIAIKD